MTTSKLDAELALDASVGRTPRFKAGVAIKLALSGLILGALFWKLHADLPSLRHLDTVSVVAAVGLLLLQPALVGLRWWLVLRMYGADTSPGAAVAITWVSIFANQFLPTSVGGDAVRIFYAPRLGTGLGTAIASVVIDRLVALLALAVLIVVLSPFLSDRIDQRITVAFGSLCLVGIIGALVIFRLTGSVSGASPRWPALQRVAQLARDALQIVAHPVRAGIALAIAAAVHVLSLAALLLISRSIGVDIAAGPFLAVAAILAFVQAVPISIGGWGVREAAAVTLLGLLGVDPGRALLSSVVLGISYAVASLPGAAIWPYLTGRRREPIG